MSTTCRHCGHPTSEKILKEKTIKMKEHELKSYQDWCVETIAGILQKICGYKGTLIDQGYRYSIDAILKHYASMYYCIDQDSRPQGKHHVNMWWNFCQRERRELMFAKLMMSTCAREKILEKRNEPTSSLKGLLQFEHITPCATVYEKLCELCKGNQVTIASVRKCFRHNKLVLITKEESRILDGRGAHFDANDLLYVKNNFASEFADASRHFADSPKSGGTALLRLAKLFNNGVRFCSFPEGNMPPARWIDYLSDASFTI